MLGPPVVVMMVVIVVVAMATPAQFQDHERQPGGDQDRAHDCVLGALDGRAELQAHDDDHRTQDDRHQHVGHAGQARQPGHPREGVAAGAPQDRQRHPVIGQHGVPKGHARGGGQQGRAVRGHVELRR
jgi:hypothetical protein